MSYPVTLYVGNNYSDESQGVDYGDYPWLPTIGFPNDALSSLKIAPFTKVSLFCDGSYGGCRFDYLGPMEISDLRATGFNDSASSMQVVPITPTLETQINCCNGTSSAYQCGKYVPGSATCTDSMTQWCSTHMSDPKCKSWCTNNTAICDPFAQTYCDQNPTDPYCACIKSPAKGIGGVNPKCIDAACLAGGYLTTAMKNTNCPSIIDCSIKTTLENTGIIFSNTTPIQQNCGNTTVVAPPGTTVVVPPNNPTTTNTVTNVTNVTNTPGKLSVISNYVHDHMWILLAFIFLVFIAILLFTDDIMSLDFTEEQQNL